VYGDNSVSLAKTLKVIGTLLIIQGNREEARRCLNEALMAFELRGQTKLIKETTLKIKQINKNPNFNRQQIYAEIQNEIQD
jgi:biotin carboxylase